MGSSLSSNSSVQQQEDIRLDSRNRVIHEQQKVLSNQLLNYCNLLEKHSMELDSVERSFLPVSHKYIINIMGRKQCESYQKYHSFTLTDLNIMRSIHKLAHFDVDKHAIVKNILVPLRKAYSSGSLDQVKKEISQMKNRKMFDGVSFSAIDFQLLDILDYTIDVCLRKNDSNNNNNEESLDYWTDIFDILFRGTNIKLSRMRQTKFSNDKELTTKDIRSQNILFQCKVNGTQSNFVELAICAMSCKDSNDTVQENDDKEAIIQSNSILTNYKILVSLLRLLSQFNYTYQDLIDFCPIYMQLTGNVGYFYSLRFFNGVYIASQVCEDIIYLPRTEEEFKHFLFHSHVFEMLCNLKVHCVNVAEAVRHASSSTSFAKNNKLRPIIAN